MSEETGLTRRQALAAAAALCGAGALAVATATPAAAATLQVDLSRHPSLNRVGGIALVGALGGRQVAVVRATAKKFVAVDRTCPHAGAIVVQQAGRWLCPAHGSTFDLDGDRIGGPTPTGLRKLRAKRSGNVLTISG